MIISSSIHVVANAIISFFFMAEFYSIVCVCVCVCVCVHMHIYVFTVNITMNIWVQRFGCTDLFKLESSGYVPGVKLLDHMVILFFCFF